MQGNGVVVAVNLVPREQHLCLLSSLYGLEVGCCLFVGEMFSSPSVDFVFAELRDKVPVVYQEGFLPIGPARRALIEQAAGAVEQYGRDQVLFLDDDCVLFQSELKKMRERCGKGVGCIAIQSENEVEMFKGYPSFDFFCTLVPSEYVVLAAADECLLDLLGRLKFGVCYFVMDWWFRQQGCFFNVLEEPVLHVYIQDEYKLWGDWGVQRWSEVYGGIMRSRSLCEVEAFLEGRGLLNSRYNRR